MRLPLLAATAALALSACAAGPDYVAPLPRASASGPFLSASPAVADAPAEEDWWRLYRDPVLDRLVADALAANTDVRVAVARLARARAALREVRTDRLPNVGIGASATYGRAAESQVPAGADR
jgi:outer membrane protein TolC